MPRIYRAPCPTVALASGLELFSLYMNTNNALATLRRLIISPIDASLPTAQSLSIQIYRYNAATQSTTGATLVTPNPDDPGDAASAATVYYGANPASTGTLEWQHSDGCYLYTGRDLIIPLSVECPKTRLISVQVPNAPVTTAGTPHIAATLEWEERGK